MSSFCHRFILILVYMKKIIFIVLLCLFSSKISNAQNFITHILSGEKCTHTWYYMPKGDTLTIDGLKDKSYPIKLKPSETYIISEPINISCFKNIGVDYRYYVATNRNHTLSVDLLNLNEDVFATYELSGTINTSTKTIGGYFTGLNFDEPVIKIKFRLTGAYSESEFANINEFQLYGTKKEWKERSIHLLDPIISSNNVKLNWVTVDDAVKYDVIYKKDNTTSSTTISITAIDSLIQTVELNDLPTQCNYIYQVVAYNENGEKLTSDKSAFETTGISEIYNDTNDYNIECANGKLFITTKNNTSSISIYNIQGVAIIENKKLTTGSNVIDLTDGMYVIKINNKGQIILVQ